MDSLLDALKSMGSGRLAIMLLTFFGMVVFFIIIAARSGAPDLTLLYSDLSAADSTEIAAKLDTAGITYQLAPDSAKISVAQKDVGKARMLLAQEGLPRQGSVGYEIFDQKQSFGTTSFVQNINQVRALEGELSRTIGTLEQVRNARVHLVLPQRELFSREQRPATASVFLSLRNNATLGQEQIQSIQHLVAASVPQLKAANVAIIDQGGNLLARGEEEGGNSAGGAEDLRQKYEMRLSRSLEDMVGRIVGYGRVRATVTANLNFDVVSRNSESFDPESQVVRSTQTSAEESLDNTGSAAAAVSVENNLPGLPNSGGTSTETVGSKNSRVEEVTNFEISKTVESVVRESGEVQKLSIAVLVDGRYEPDTSVARPEDAAEDWQPPKKYVARQQDELDKISALVKSAVGYDESRGDVVDVINMPFAEVDIAPPPVKDNTIMGFSRSDIVDIGETMMLSIVAVLIILLVLRPLATHIVATSGRAISQGMSAQEEAALLTAQAGGQAQLAPPGGAISAGGGNLDSMIDMSSVEGKVKASSVQKISELVTSHPNETVSVIRQWMSQES